MNPDAVTPVVLTRDEAPNVPRLLEGLGWARRIVVVDSHSDDATVELLSEDPRVEIFPRAFDTFAEQWNHGLSKVETEWVLSLDADYVCPPELADEIRGLPDDPPESGFDARFRYAIFGRVLRGSLYPPRTVLHRLARSTYVDDGHTQRLHVEGRRGRLRTFLVHDDRKPLGRWLAAQRRYARLEAEKLLEDDALGLADRLRRAHLGPALVPLHCLFAKGLALDGRAGLYYTLQRTCFEVVLSLSLLDRRLRGEGGAPDPAARTGRRGRRSS